MIGLRVCLRISKYRSSPRKTSSLMSVPNQIIQSSDLDGLVYTPANNYLGADSFKWTGADGGAYASPVASTNLTVAALLITGSGISIANGDTKPDTTDFTDFARTATGGPALTRTYIITNITNSTISLTGGASLVQVAGGTNSEFVVTTQPADTLAPNGTTSFTITFTPTHAGLRTNTVSIPNNTPGSSARHWVT